MPTMFKKNLITDYANKAGITKIESEKRIEEMLGIVEDYLVCGHDVKLNNFFNFFNKVRDSKEGVNPITGESMVIPSTRTIHARMTKSLKERIQGKR